ncbi:MAG: 5-formyltetrahydrofolate cyclo-ligase [Brachybacterium sp.]|nr:5-formyltetrahydrofolate cyclo-ligase [Brachybacterium sp.]
MATPLPAIEQKAALRRSLRVERRRQYRENPAAVERRGRESQALLHHLDWLRSALESARAARSDTGDAAPLIAAFHPTADEPDLLPLVRALIEDGARAVFPVAAGRELEWGTWDGDATFVRSTGRGFGLEPPGRRLGTDALASAALVLAPAAAVDRSGTRLGHGGGYYDRALGYRMPSTPVIAVVHPSEVLPAGMIPRLDHDVPVDAALTAEGPVVLRPESAGGGMLCRGT